jgi:D-alanyl-D-alanine carboxypeptidase (penicillin-binding protein 5/6)
MKAQRLVLCIALLKLFNPNIAFAGQPKKAVVTKKADSSANISEEGITYYPGAPRLGLMAKQAIVTDFRSGKVLLEKNADERMAPSSMTKMMTTYILEEKLAKGELKPDSQFFVSKKAWSTQGSKMFVHVGDKVAVADLHRGIAIQSGNDASIVVAEGIKGSEAQFAAEMNLVASQLGMKASNFKNASGLNEDGHYSTARDLSILASAIIKNHPQFYPINQEKYYSYNGIQQGNRNPLLYDNIGCDGIKTGHTDAGGFGITASCVDGDQRANIVLNGLPSMQARADESRRVVTWVKENFIGKVAVKKGDVMVKGAKVELGLKADVPLVASDDLYMLMLRNQQKDIKITTNIEEPLKAPIKAGSRLGTVTASIGDNQVTVDLLAAESVEKLGWFKRMLKWLRII